MHTPAPQTSHPLHDRAASRALEQAAQNPAQPQQLMQSAGLAAARLALALAPHARRIWIACGPGNNGGDGLEAGRHLHLWGHEVELSWAGTPDSAPAPTRAAWVRARDSGVRFSPAPPASYDLGLDAILGLGATRAPDGRLGEWVQQLNGHAAPVLALDLPSGLDPDTGMPLAAAAGSAADPAQRVVRARWTLSLLTLKPGLFTGMGRELAGQVWLDRLGVDPTLQPASAILGGAPAPHPRAQHSHKGDFGDVAVLGGAAGMQGAAVLAARAALGGGAGRVYLGLLDGSVSLDPLQAELMCRAPETIDLTRASVVCGCGGGEAVAAMLPRVLAQARTLVLDADALNALARDPMLMSLLRARAQRNGATVLTPHPLEAARLLACSSAEVQAHRLAAAQALAQDTGCTVVLKGSGTVLAQAGQLAHINPTGNARLATAGTGDVLAGRLGALLAHACAQHAHSDWAAQRALCWHAARAAVWWHGQQADAWPAAQPLNASALALRPA